MSKEKRIHIVKSIIKHALLLCVGFFWIGDPRYVLKRAVKRAEAALELIDILQKEGYVFVTADELLIE